MSSNNDFISLDTLARTQSTSVRAAVMQVMMSGLVTPQAGQTVRQPGTNRLNRNLLRYKPRPQPARSHWLLESVLQVFPDSFPLNADVQRPAADVGSTSGCGSVAKPGKNRPTERCLPCPASALPRFIIYLFMYF